MIGMSHDREPSVISVQPWMVSSDVDHTSVFIKRGVLHNLSWEPRSTSFGTILEACRSMVLTVHVPGSNDIVLIDGHCSVKVGMLGIDERLENTVARLRIEFINHFLWHGLSDYMVDEVKEPSTEGRVNFGLLSHLSRGGSAPDPQLKSSQRFNLRGDYRKM